MAISVTHDKVASNPETPKLTNTDWNAEHVVAGVIAEPSTYTLEPEDTEDTGGSYTDPYIFGTNGEQVLYVGTNNCNVFVQIDDIDNGTYKIFRNDSENSTFLRFTNAVTSIAQFLITQWDDQPGLQLECATGAFVEFEFFTEKAIGGDRKNVRLIDITPNGKENISWSGNYDIANGFTQRSTLNASQMSNLHAPGSDDQDLSGLVPNTRTINGFPLTDDITIDTVQDGFLSSYFFCDDVIHSTTPPWHELEKQSDGGTTGSHTATTSDYTEMDRYVINPVPGTTLVPEGNWIFTLYAKVTAVTAMAGQLKAEVYRVDSDGAIVGAVLGTAESAAFTNTVVAPITLSVFIAEQTIDATDTIGVIIYGKKTTVPAATITWYHDRASGYLSQMQSPITLLHNQLEGLNQGDYIHLTYDQWASVIDGANADSYHYHAQVIKSSLTIEETPYSMNASDWNKIFIINVDNCEIDLAESQGGAGSKIEFQDNKGTSHTFNAYEDGLLYFKGTSDTSYVSKGLLYEKFIWKQVDGGYALIEASDLSECYNLVAGKIPAPTAGDDGKYLQYDNASGEFVYDAPAGTGDVVGPGSSEDGNIAVFDGTGGKTIKDGASTIAEVISSAKLAAWPVGAVYISVDSTSPQTLFGGTWAAFGAGKVLVGIDSGDADFDTVEETGGSKTVAAAGSNAAEASHTHSVTSNVTSAANTGSESTHTHTYTQVVNHTHTVNVGSANDTSTVTGAGNYFAGTTSTVAATTGNPSGGVASGTTSAGDSHNHSSPALTNNAVTSGTGSSHNHNFTGSATSVVQPYIVVYMWKRTA